MIPALSAALMILCFLAVPPVHASPISESPEMATEEEMSEKPLELRRALAAFRKGQFNESLDQLRRAAQKHAELPPPEFMLANMYFSDGQDAKGRTLLEDAAVKYSKDPEPHLIFGDLAFRERRFSDAHVQYEKADQLLQEFSGPPERKRPLLIRAFSGKANVAEAQHRYEDAQAEFAALLKLDPQNPLAHFRLGNVLFAQGKPEEALAKFREAAQMSEAAPSPQLTMVELYKQAGKTDEAQRQLQAAVEESPEDLRVLLTMARWQVEMRNDPEAAMPYLSRAVQLDPDSTELSFLRGIVAWCNHELGKAERLFESITLKEPENLRANNCLAVVLAEQNDPKRRQRASVLVQISAGANPSSLETAAAVGCVAYLLGDMPKAARYLQAAVARGAGRDAAYYLARTQFRQGQLARAAQTLENALAAEGLFVHRSEALRWQQELTPAGINP